MFFLLHRSIFYEYFRRSLTWVCFSVVLFLVLCIILDKAFGIVHYWFQNTLNYRNSSAPFLALCFLIWSGLMFISRENVKQWWACFLVGTVCIYIIYILLSLAIFSDSYLHRVSASLNGHMYHVTYNRGAGLLEKSLDVYQCDPWGMFCRQLTSLPPYYDEDKDNKVQIRVEPEQNMVYIVVDKIDVYRFQP